MGRRKFTKIIGIVYVGSDEMERPFLNDIDTYPTDSVLACVLENNSEI